MGRHPRPVILGPSRIWLGRTFATPVFEGAPEAVDRLAAAAGALCTEALASSHRSGRFSWRAAVDWLTPELAVIMLAYYGPKSSKPRPIPRRYSSKKLRAALLQAVGPDAVDWYAVSMVATPEDIRVAPRWRLGTLAAITYWSGLDGELLRHDYHPDSAPDLWVEDGTLVPIGGAYQVTPYVGIEDLHHPEEAVH